MTAKQPAWMCTCWSPTSLTCVHDALIHLYILQLFMHCLPTVICDIKFNVLYMYDSTYLYLCILLLLLIIMT